MNEEFLINFCRRDQVWLVMRKTARKEYFYITVAECFTEEAAELLRNSLIKDIKQLNEESYK